MTPNSDLDNYIVSVIVPVYNVEEYLKRCVDSLRNQSLQNIEIILVDDGSTDHSGTLCDEYQNEDRRIKVIHKENAGQGLARNDGLKMATGQYVCFLDSDDYLETNALSELSLLAEDSKADMVTFGYEIDDPDGKCVTAPRIEEKEYIGEDIRNEFILHFFGDDPQKEDLRGFSSCMSFFRREVILEYDIHFPSEREVLTEDTVFCLEFCAHAERIVTTSKIYYHYVQKKDSFSHGYMNDRMAKTVKMAKLLSEYAVKYGIREKVDIRLAMYVWVNLMATLKQIALTFESDYAECRRIMDKELDHEVIDRIRVLKGAGLPLKQNIMLWAVIKKRIRMVMLLCRIRNSRGL